MKRLLSGLLALAFVGSMSSIGQAQTATDRGTTNRPAKTERPAWTNSEGLQDSRDLVGTRVEDASGKEVGKVQALLIDPKDGKVSHTVIGVGGVLGIGKDEVVVKWSDLKVAAQQRNGRKVMLTVDRGVLDQAPAYAHRSDRGSASPATTRPTEKPTERKY